jgi:FdhD protein
LAHPGARSTTARRLRYHGTIESSSPVAVPVEVAANVVYAELPYAVMMVSPGDLEDFATGFSLTEGVARHAADIRGVRVEPQGDGLLLHVDLVPAALQRHMARRRSLHGRTSCGLCGIESIDQLPGAEMPVLPAAPVAAAAIQRALAELDAHQPLNRLTRGVHAAAWCDVNGRIVLAREDVGRHNALDKLIGACLRAGVSAEAGFVLLTSRCSFEMIEKAAIFGAATVVAISAPTSLAIDRADALGITLVALARPDSALQFGQPTPTFASEAVS